MANLITRPRYRRVNPPLPTPAVRSFIHFSSFSFFTASTSSSLVPFFLFFFFVVFFFFAQPPRAASSPPDRIFSVPSNADYKPPGFMSIPGIEPRKKGRETPRRSSFTSSPFSPPSFLSRTGTPLDYRGGPINQVRAGGCKMDIGEHLGIFSERVRVYLSSSISAFVPHSPLVE